MRWLKSLLTSVCVEWPSSFAIEGKGIKPAAGTIPWEKLNLAAFLVIQTCHNLHPPDPNGGLPWWSTLLVQHTASAAWAILSMVMLPLKLLLVNASGSLSAADKYTAVDQLALSRLISTLNLLHSKLPRIQSEAMQSIALLNIREHLAPMRAFGEIKWDRDSINVEPTCRERGKDSRFTVW